MKPKTVLIVGAVVLILVIILIQISGKNKPPPAPTTNSVPTGSLTTPPWH